MSCVQYVCLCVCGAFVRIFMNFSGRPGRLASLTNIRHVRRLAGETLHSLSTRTSMFHGERTALPDFNDDKYKDRSEHHHQTGTILMFRLSVEKKSVLCREELRWARVRVCVRVCVYVFVFWANTSDWCTQRIQTAGKETVGKEHGKQLFCSRPLAGKVSQMIDFEPGGWGWVTDPSVPWGFAEVICHQNHRR